MEISVSEPVIWTLSFELKGQEFFLFLCGLLRVAGKAGKTFPAKIY